MDRSRATCGGQADGPDNEVEKRIQFEDQRFLRHAAGLRSMREDEDARRGPARRLGVGTGTRAGLRVSLDGRLQQPRKGALSRSGYEGDIDTTGNATRCNLGQCRKKWGKTLGYGGFAALWQTRATPDRSLVAGAGQRFRVRSSAHLFPANPMEIRSPRCSGGLLSNSTSAVDSIPKPRPRNWRATSGCRVQQVA